MTINKYESLLDFNKKLDEVIRELSATWKGKKVEEKQHDPKLALIKKIIETNHTLLIKDTQNHAERLHAIKTLKKLSDLTHKIDSQDEYFETEIKTIALCLRNLSKGKDDVEESIATIKTLQEVDENLYLQTLAEWINTQKVPITEVKLSEEQMLKLAPYLTYLNIADEEWDWETAVARTNYALTNITDAEWDEEIVAAETNYAFTEEFIGKLLKNSPNLIFLSINNSSFTGEALAALNGHEKLQQLIIEGCPAFNQPLPKLENLRQVIIEGCSAFNQPLDGFKNLEKLIIKSCHDFNQSFTKLEKLQQLAIWDCPAFNQPFFKLKNLKQLMIKFCKFTTLPDLSACEKLTSLLLASCDNLITPPNLSNCKKLAILQLLDCDNLTTPPDLSACKELQILDLSKCDKLEEPPNLSNCKKLAILQLVDCGDLTTPPDLSACKELQLLNFSGCGRLATLPSLSACKKLTTLSLSNCNELTISPDLSDCKELVKLNLSNCDNLTTPPDLSDCPALLTFSLSGSAKIQTFIANILKANIAQQELEEHNISDLQTHIAKKFPFLNNIFEDAKEQKNPHIRKSLIAWLAYTAGVLNSLEQEKVTAIEDTRLLRDIYNYRVPRMRDGLVHSLYSLSLEKIKMMNEAFVGKKKRRNLPIIFLVEMLEKGMSKEHFDALVDKIDQEKEFKNADFLTALISFLKNLSIAKDISWEDPVKLLDLAFRQKSGKEKIKTLRTMDALLGLFGGERLKKVALETENPDLEESFRIAFMEIFPISDIDNFSDRYEEKIASRGHVSSLFAYLKSVDKLPRNEQKKVSPLLTKFVYSMLKGIFSGVRYDTENNPHLQTVFNYFSEMEKESKGIDYIALWKKAPEPKSIVETEEPKEVEPFDFENFFETKIFTDKHLEPKDFPQLRAFLDFPENNTKILKELREHLKDMRKRKEAESVIAKVQFQMKAIELCNPRKQIKQKEVLLSELEKILGKLPESEEFQNDLETAKSMLKPPAVKSTEYKVSETDEAWDLFLIGTIIRSCQRVDGDPTRNKCLLAYVMDGKNKAIVVKDRRGRIVARTMLRLLWDEKKGKPVLLQERLYSNVNDPKIEKAIDQWAIDRAKQLGLTLVSKERGSGKPYDSAVASLGSSAPFEYSDASGGVTNGTYRIEGCHILYSPPASS